MKFITSLILVLGMAACTAPTSLDTSTQARAITDKFFNAMAAEDADTALSLLTPDATLHAPYNPNGDASDAGIRSLPAALYVKGAMVTYDNLVFEDRKYSLADNGQTMWVEAEGRLRVAATGKPYENRYVFKLDFDGDKIASITEYTNVATLTKHGVAATPPK